MDDPPPKFTSVEAPKHGAEDYLFNEIMFEDDNTSVGFILVPTTFNELQKHSSSKPYFYFGLSLTFEEHEKENHEENKHPSPHPKATLGVDLGDKTQGDPIDHSKISEPNGDEDNDVDDDNKKSEISTSDIGSSDKNNVDLFSLLELQDNISLAKSNANKLD